MVEARSILDAEDYRLELMSSKKSDKPKTSRERKKLKQIEEHDKLMKRMGLFEE